MDLNTASKGLRGGCVPPPCLPGRRTFPPRSSSVPYLLAAPLSSLSAGELSPQLLGKCHPAEARAAVGGRNRRKNNNVFFPHRAAANEARSLR